MQYVKSYEVEQKKYVLLQPGNYPARTGSTYQCLCGPEDLPAVLEAISQSEFVAVDFETRGTDYSLDATNFGIIGIGLAFDTGSAYFHWADLSGGDLDIGRPQLIESLLSHRGILCHNLYFDGGVVYQWTSKNLPKAALDGGIVYQETGRHFQAAACTYSLTAHLANESPEQRWGLKDLMLNLLGWTETNEVRLDEWLVTNQYYTGNRRKDNSPESLLQEYRTGTLRPDKSQMWRVPREILGEYCVRDAEATYLLFTEVLRPILDQYPGLIKQQEELLHLVRLLIEQRMGGIEIDRAALLLRTEEVRTQMQAFVETVVAHPDMSNHIQEIERGLLRPLIEKEPERLKKNGEASKNWLKWKQKLGDARAGLVPDYKFNINSDFHLRDLLYNRMGFEIKQTTESGLAGTSIKALSSMGEIGQLLIEYNYLQKELGFLESYIEMTEYRPTIHPSFRVPGAVTGRLSSKVPNLQQVPKTRSMMSMFRASPGTVWVDVDFAALESVVAAEFSQDPNMLALYGDGVPENDVHLFLAAQVPGAMGEAVLSTGYTPINPPPGSVAKAKKEAKRWRSIAKTCVYAMQFGAGARKLMETLEAENVFLPRGEVETIYNTYWEVFAKLKDYGKSLWYEWRRNGGWILNGMGRPMCVADNYSKDLLSRFIQSTGHDILVKYVYILTHELCRRDIPWRPVIIDWHDATTVEVPEAYCQDVVDTMNWAMGELNRQLGGTIQMRGKPTWGVTLADIKEPEN